MIHMHEWDWARAQQSFNQAISSNPNYPMAHYWYAFLLVAGGRRSEAENEIQQALKLDPLSLIFNLANTMLIGDAKQLQWQAQKVLNLEPNFWLTHSYLGVRYAQMGKQQDAIAFAEKGQQISNNSKVGSAMLGYVYAMAGERHKAEKLIQDLQKRAGREYVAPFLFAWIYVGLGNADEAFTWLEKAVEQQDAYMLLLFSWEPSFEPLRKDPRYTEILKKMGLRP
jgi:tetratricopeptide (TPR) repeat protein